MTNDPGHSVTNLHPEQPADVLLRAIARFPESSATEVATAMRSLLMHSDADVREEVLRRVAVHWRHIAFRNDCVSALRSDPSESVRATAAYGLAALSTSETRTSDLLSLLAVIKDSALDGALRLAAYDAALLITGRRPLPQIEPDPNASAMIEWTLVRDIEQELRGRPS